MDILFKDPNELIPFIDNPKQHPKRQIDMIKKSIQEFGFYQPIIVNKDLMIIAGHARRLAAIDLGMTRVPTIVLNMDYPKAVACVIGDNRLAALGVDDLPLLQKNTQLIQEAMPDFDVEAMGYDLDELTAMLTIDNNFSFSDTDDEDPDDIQFIEGDKCGKSFAVHVSFSDKDRAELFLTQIGAMPNKFGKGKTSTIVHGDELMLEGE